MVSLLHPATFRFVVWERLYRNKWNTIQFVLFHCKGTVLSCLENGCVIKLLNQMQDKIRGIRCCKAVKAQEIVLNIVFIPKTDSKQCSLAMCVLFCKQLFQSSLMLSMGKPFLYYSFLEVRCMMWTKLSKDITSFRNAQAVSHGIAICWKTVSVQSSLIPYGYVWCSTETDPIVFGGWTPTDFIAIGISTEMLIQSLYVLFLTLAGSFRTFGELACECTIAEDFELCCGWKSISWN